MIAIHLVLPNKNEALSLVDDLLAQQLIFDAKLNVLEQYVRLGQKNTETVEVVARAKALLFSKVRNRLAQLNCNVLMCYSVPIAQIDENEGNDLLEFTERV